MGNRLLPPVSLQIRWGDPRKPGNGGRHSSCDHSGSRSGTTTAPVEPLHLQLSDVDLWIVWNGYIRDKVRSNEGMMSERVCLWGCGAGGAGSL